MTQAESFRAYPHQPKGSQCFVFLSLTQRGHRANDQAPVYKQLLPKRSVRSEALFKHQSFITLCMSEGRRIGYLPTYHRSLAMKFAVFRIKSLREFVLQGHTEAIAFSDPFSVLRNDRIPHPPLKCPEDLGIMSTPSLTQYGPQADLAQ